MTSLDHEGQPGGQGGSLAATLYQELHRIADRHMRRNPGHSLQATDLVHEAYVRLVKADGSYHEDRSFLAAAGKAMRSVLVDHARAKSRLKRTAPGERVPLDDLADCFEERALDLLALDEALADLAGFDERMVRAVELRFFAGSSAAQTASALGMPLRTFEHHWAATKAWLHRRMR